MLTTESSLLLECGSSWGCGSCMHLHHEIEGLRRAVREKDNLILHMEDSVLREAERFGPRGQLHYMHQQLDLCKEKYDRLLDSYRKLQRINQGLEDKLLRVVDHYESEKGSMGRDLTEVSSRLVETSGLVTRLQDENEKLKTDCSLAVQLLHCKPSSFVAHRLDSLPEDLQRKVNQQMKKKESPNHTEGKKIRVPISTFPPTAMVYSVNKETKEQPEDDGNKPDLVSAAIMAKVLKERERERRSVRHCATCACTKTCQKNETSTQTEECTIVFLSELDKNYVNNSKDATSKTKTYTNTLLDLEKEYTQLKKELTPPAPSSLTKMNLYNSSRLSSQPSTETDDMSDSDATPPRVKSRRDYPANYHRYNPSTTKTLYSSGNGHSITGNGVLHTSHIKDTSQHHVTETPI